VSAGSSIQAHSNPATVKRGAELPLICQEASFQALSRSPANCSYPSWSVKRTVIS